MPTEEAFRALERIYGELDEELRAFSPLCRMSGECCRFARAGHRLYTTSLEFEYLRKHTGLAGARPELLAEGTCPFLREGKCGVRNHRMLGCRIYFCDPAFQPHMAGIYEKYHARIREILREHGIPYSYFNYLEAMRDSSSAGSARDAQILGVGRI